MDRSVARFWSVKSVVVLLTRLALLFSSSALFCRTSCCSVVVVRSSFGIVLCRKLAFVLGLRILHNDSACVCKCADTNPLICGRYVCKEDHCVVLASRRRVCGVLLGVDMCEERRRMSSSSSAGSCLEVSCFDFEVIGGEEGERSTFSSADLRKCLRALRTCAVLNL